jgi:hypothetical protein
MLTASADRSIIGVAESTICSGPIHAFSASASAYIASSQLNAFVYDIGVNLDGTHFAVPTYGNGTAIFNRSGGAFNLVTSLGTTLNGEPIYTVYSPNSHYLFASYWDSSDSSKSGVVVYDTSTWTIVATLQNYNFQWVGNAAFVDGWLRVSSDGTMLAVREGNTTALFDVSAFAASVPEPSGIILGLTGLGLVGAILAHGRCTRRATRTHESV